MQAQIKVCRSDHIAFMHFLICKKGNVKRLNQFFSSLVFLLGFHPVLQGQQLADTTLVLPTVEVRSASIRYEVAGSATQYWEAAQLARVQADHLAGLLAAETGTYIKSYGLGSLATSSIRGGSAGHTLVLWNGLPIQSPMLGLLDLALLPVQAVESIGFTPGGGSAMWGSGAIGGVLDLDNRAHFSRKMELKTSTLAGSFGQFQQQINIGLGTEKVQSVTRFAHQQADNDFYYPLGAGLPKRLQTNARFSQQYAVQDLYWNIHERRRLSAHLWLQETSREIPPTQVQNRSEARQEDSATRLVLEYRAITARGFWQIKTGYFYEHLQYVDDQILLNSRSHFRTYLAEITREWQGGKRHTFLLGNTHVHTQAWSEGYRNQIPTEYKTALFASWKYRGRKLNAQGSLRQEIAGGIGAPIVPALGVDYQIHPNFLLKSSASRNYRLPTLNDRFWAPGGNPDLLPESGWSQELGFYFRKQKNGFELQASLTAFNRTIGNWILWSLRDGQSFWSANNITQVWSRGLEPRLALSHTSSHRKFVLKAGYDFTRSTNQVAVENPSLAAGQQLLYTPVHRAFASLSLEWKTFYAAYQHAFTGAAQGINDPIAPFQTGNLRLQYGREFKKGRGMLFLNVLNIWNAQYLAVERRPMPGIHFQSGIQLFFYQNT